MSLNVRIITIPHKDQRYETVGDWQWNSPGNLFITVSNMGDWRKEFLVGVHELIEAMLCRERQIHQSDIDNFDIMYEAQRLPNDTSEPGDSPLAPYKKEHQFATNIESLICAELGLDWNEYEETVNSL